MTSTGHSQNTFPYSDSKRDPSLHISCISLSAKNRNSQAGHFIFEILSITSMNAVEEGSSVDELLVEKASATTEGATTERALDILLT
jgi:hypothetical protein